MSFIRGYKPPLSPEEFKAKHNTLKEFCQHVKCGAHQVKTERKEFTKYIEANACNDCMAKKYQEFISGDSK